MCVWGYCWDIIGIIGYVTKTQCTETSAGCDGDMMGYRIIMNQEDEMGLSKNGGFTAKVNSNFKRTHIMLI